MLLSTAAAIALTCALRKDNMWVLGQGVAYSILQLCFTGRNNTVLHSQKKQFFCCKRIVVWWGWFHDARQKLACMLARLKIQSCRFAIVQ